MALKSRVISGRARRLIPLAAALLLAALMAVPSSNPALAQAPPGAEITLVNEDEGFVERKKDGRFIARPVFDRKPASLYYGVRHPDSGDWLTAVYRVQGGEKERRDGWEDVLLGLTLRGRPARSRPRAGVPAGHAGPGRRQRGAPHLPRGHSGASARGPVEQDSGSPRPRAVGQSLSPGGPSRESTGPSAAWWRRPAARTPPTAGEISVA